jgi:hypothetical protein
MSEKFVRTPFYRRKLFIAPLSQLKIIGFNLFLLIFVFVFLYVIIDRSLLAYIREAHFNMGNGGVEMSEELQALRVYFIQILLGAFVVCFSGFVFVSLALSHRLTGPIYKMTKVLKELSDENRTDEAVLIQLRKDDFFKELAEALNQYIKKNQRSAK